MTEQKRDRSVNPSLFLRIFDAVTGVFVELFDPRLLTLAAALLLGYCTLFTQRKFPGRWMEFVAYGLVLIAIVTVAARTPGMLRRMRWHPAMLTLWALLHGWMLLSGFFFEDWLPESLALLVAYPFMFAVFTARDDTSTLYAITRGAVYGILPFLVWSYIATPVQLMTLPGFSGVFYNANGLAMCATIFAVCALLLAYAGWQKRHLRSALWYLALCALGGVTVLLTLSRSAYVAFAAVMLVLIGCLWIQHVKHAWRVVAILTALAVVGSIGIYQIGKQKAHQAAIDEWEDALRIAAQYDVMDPNVLPPDERPLTLDDFTSSRSSIWEQALTHLTWNGHPSAVVEEWAAINGGLNRRNAHNSFVGVAYNNGWPAGILFVLYVGLSAQRAWVYYWRRRKTQPMAVAPLLLTVLFIVVSLFESVYSPFSVVGCAFLLVQGMLWRANLSPEPPGAPEEAA